MSSEEWRILSYHSVIYIYMCVFLYIYIYIYILHAYTNNYTKRMVSHICTVLSSDRELAGCCV